jgi:formylglycine-generating enzyme required for sulfatase activity
MSGGSWVFVPWYCRSATRDSFEPGLTVGDDGFRVVCNEPERSIPADKVISGGSYNSFPRSCRSACRGRVVPVNSIRDHGFRVVCNE